MSIETTRKDNPHTRRVRTSSLILLSLLGLAALGAGGLYAYAASNVSLNNVQVNVVTSANLPYNFVVSAYNTTGSLVSYTQTNYPAAAFMLPSGSYLFTVTAYHYDNYPCNYCAYPAGYDSKTAVSQGGTPSIYPVRYGPNVEYGFSLQQVSGAATITINTQNATNIPTSNVSVKVTYANGTAAAGASVSAFVVGQSYYWWGYNSGISMYTQTDSQGMATLTVPQAPVEISSSLSVPVNIPQSESTVQVIIGGQKVNVTVYWQPMYVYLSGSALLIPPQTSADITLQYQQSNIYYPLAYSSPPPPMGGVTYTSSGTATGQQGAPQSQSGSGQTAASQGLGAPANKISAFGASSHLSTTSSGGSSGLTPSTQGASAPASNGGSTLLLVSVAVVAVAASVAGLVVITARGRQ
jgi:hypothetical protein